MPESTEQKIYEIPVGHKDRLHKEIAKLNKRAEKLGCEPVELVDHGEVLRVDPVYIQRISTPEHPYPAIPEDAPKIRYMRISINGDAPKLAGYTFVGTLDHVVLPGSVVVKAVPGENVPEEFYDHDAYCDHCNKIRRRNQTFVLFNEEENKHVQVGRQCLRDFLGHDPNAIARFLSAVWRLMDSFDDEETWGMGSGGYREWSYNHVRVLELTSAIIRHSGWVPRSSANPDEGRSATADEVAYALTPKFTAAERKIHDKFMAELDVNKNDREEAEAAIEWLKEQPTNNEYMHNLHAIANADAVPISMFGFWCSLVAAYQRAQERLRVNMAQRKLNEYVGKVKERREFTVKVIGISYIDGYFGTVRLHRMLDEDGHTLVWFANTSSGMDNGGKYRIKGTVKDHSEYKDWKQTVLSRVKMLEEIEEEG